MAEVFIVYILFYLVFGAILGFLCSYIAGTKNRDKVGYFFLGFFFGIVGIIVAAAVPKLEDEDPDEYGGLYQGDLKGVEVLFAHKDDEGMYWPFYVSNSLNIQFDSQEGIYFGVTENRMLAIVENDYSKYQTEISNIELIKIMGAEFATDDVGEGPLGVDANPVSAGVPFNPNMLVSPSSWYITPAKEDLLLEIIVYAKNRNIGSIIFDYGEGEEAEELLQKDMERLLELKNSPKTVISTSDGDHGNPSEPITVSKEVKECPYCAEIIKAKAIKCRYCGSTLSESK